MKKITLLILLLFSFNIFANTNYNEEFEKIVEEVILDEKIPKALQEDFKGFAFYYYFERLRKKNLVTCILCNSHSVKKTIMAPQFLVGGNRGLNFPGSLLRARHAPHTGLPAG